MENKICLVTGANAGIGYETAKGLAARGARVLMVCRDMVKGEVAKAEIVAATGNQQVELLLCDLSQQKAIRALSDAVHQRCDRLDVLVNNAGAYFSDRRLSADGIEMQFATNHLAYYLLTRLLMDLLLASGSARVVNVSSNGHYNGRLNLADLGQEKGSYSGLAAYAQSKLCNVLFSKALARRVKDKGVRVNALHPGVVRTHIGNSNSKGWTHFAWRLMKPFMVTPERGAATSIYLAAHPEAGQYNGKYFVNSREKRPARLAEDAELAERLWAVSAQLTGLPEE